TGKGNGVVGGTAVPSNWLTSPMLSEGPGSSSVIVPAPTALASVACDGFDSVSVKCSAGSSTASSTTGTSTGIEVTPAAKTRCREAGWLKSAPGVARGDAPPAAVSSTSMGRPDGADSVTGEWAWVLSEAVVVELAERIGR